jgi:hypothetical protein
MPAQDAFIAGIDQTFVAARQQVSGFRRCRHFD